MNSEQGDEMYGALDQRKRCVRRAKPDLPRLKAEMHLEEEPTAMKVAKPKYDVNDQQIEECVQRS